MVDFSFKDGFGNQNRNKPSRRQRFRKRQEQDPELVHRLDAVEAAKAEKVIRTRKDLEATAEPITFNEDGSTDTGVDSNEAAANSKATGAAIGVGKQAIGALAPKNNTKSGNTNSAAGIAQGTASGASMGYQVGGAWGAVAGGVIGGVTGGMKAKSAQKREKTRIAAETAAKLAEIEGGKQDRLQRAYQGMSQAFSQTLV